MRKFHRGVIYRHLTSGDLDIYVVSNPYYDDKRSKLKIRWVSKTTGKFVHFPGDRIDGTTNIEIRSEDYIHWTVVKKI